MYFSERPSGLHLSSPCDVIDVMMTGLVLLLGSFGHRSRIRYLSKKKSRILTNFPKLKKFLKICKKIVRCPSGRGLPTTTEEYDAFHGFMLIKI